MKTVCRPKVMNKNNKGMTGYERLDLHFNQGEFEFKFHFRLKKNEKISML